MSIEAQVEAMSGRLAQWEREKRIVLWLGSAILLVFTCMLVRTVLLPSRTRTLEAQRLVLRDERGMIRAHLAMDEHGMPKFQLFDSLGREQFGLRGLPDQSAEMVFYENGLRRALLRTPPEGHATLRFDHQNGAEATQSLMLQASEPAPRTSGVPRGENLELWAPAGDRSPSGRARTILDMGPRPAPWYEHAPQRQETPA